jgi:hypothetical protein
MLMCSICHIHKGGPFLIHDFTSGFVTSVTRRAPHVEQELPILPGILSALPVFSAVRIVRSLLIL